MKSELRKLSKNELVKIILELREKLEKFEAMLRQYNNHNTPSSKKRFKKSTKKPEDPNKKRFPGREKGHQGSGIKIPKPDKVEEHTIDKVDYVKVGKRTQTVIDFTDKPIIVTKHIIYKYRAPNGRIVERKVDLPNGIYGKNLQAFNCLLKGKLGSSHESIADLIQALRPDLSFCAATSSNLAYSLAKALSFERAAILEEVRNSLYCHADETGLRQDGKNGWVWVFCNPQYAIYETDLSRSGAVPERVLGKGYNNIVVSDGWQGYNGYKKQRCWVHLLRELDKLAEDHEKNHPEIKLQANYFHNLYKQALKAKTKPPDKRIKFVRKADSQAELGFMIEALSKIKCCSEFVTKLKNARPYLFTGIINPEIPLDNNHAERMLRKVVVHRKLVGCIRNEKGRRFIENAMSVMQTWHLQGKDIYQNLKNFAS